MRSNGSSIIEKFIDGKKLIRTNGREAFPFPEGNDYQVSHIVQCYTSRTSSSLCIHPLQAYYYHKTKSRTNSRRSKGYLSSYCCSSSATNLSIFSNSILLSWRCELRIGAQTLGLPSLRMHRRKLLLPLFQSLPVIVT